MPGAALVTGATRGIGRAVVARLVAAGRRVVAVGRDQAALTALEQHHPGEVLGVASDLTVSGAAAALFAQATARVGRLDVLVYAAGVVQYEPVGAVSEASLRAQLELNFVAPFTLLQRVGTAMRDAGGGSMVVVASTLATHTAAGTAAYAASKAALVAAARTFARELAPAVRVNVVAPGVVDTDMVRVPRRPLAAGEARDDVVQAELATLRALHPLARLGTPDDVAAAVHYLLDAAWVTGSVLTVDGGLTL